MARFGEDFLQTQLERRQKWAEKGLCSGSGKSFNLSNPTSKPSSKKKVQRPVGARLGDPGYVSPHAVAMAMLAKKPDLRKGNQEYYEQVELFARIEVADPELYALTSAIPNGGYRPGKTAGMMTASGLKNGYPDVMVDMPRGVYHGCRLELKAKGGRISEAQIFKLRLLAEQGYYCTLAEGVEEAYQLLMQYRHLAPGESIPTWPRNVAWAEKENNEQ
ncbi:VRR-NUC domain-containing protein [Leclercia adecarboxylata]|uniref:VRR-NUC domain-containing protein n=1 Tax=Leclercia adecarboxylata TaxID=83655 RepID=UPI003D99B188